MSGDAIAPGNRHASVVAVERGGGWTGVLLLGAAGSGKSDLALRLIDRGWRLVADDRVLLERGKEDVVAASAPATIAGKLAIAGLGIADVAHLPTAPVNLVVQIESDPPAYPMERRLRTVCGVALPTLRVNAFWPSAPILVERALDLRPGAAE